MAAAGNFKEKQFPKSRIGTLDVFALGLKKHHVKALVELDVTLARERIRQHKEAGRAISFTAWMVKTISRTKVGIREFLYLTVLLDHDVVDGVEMARFIAGLSENVESGLGLGNA